MNAKPIIQTLLSLTGQSGVITIYRSMVKYTGSYEAAAMLSQLLYWTPLSKNDGWVAKSDKEWMDELSLSRRAVRYATNTLKSMGIIDMQLKKFNGAPTNHYKVDLETLDRSWRAWLDTSRLFQGETIHCSERDSGLSQGETMDCPEVRQSLTETTTKITTETTNIPLEKNKKPMTSEEYRKSTEEALFRGLARHKSAEEDRVNEYPEDVRPIIAAVCELFNLKCPSIKSSHAGHWIREARELCDACGEFEKQVLVEIAEDTERHKRLKGGTVPFYISGPGSLSNPARAKAGEMRNRKPVTSDTYNGYAIPHGASRVYIDGKEFIPGVGEVPA